MGQFNAPNDQANSTLAIDSAGDLFAKKINRHFWHGLFVLTLIQFSFLFVQI
ncbi:hypothetical protein SynNOUM97013_02867 [Synechococcus sp. NOUM97013]|nr:hypothetical protein SynNOUM97013_02867 [Synechococcus sp. NOUM97013]